MVNWSKLLKEPKMVALLEKMVSNGVGSLHPSVDENGNIYYPAVQEIAGEDSLRLLEELSQEGVLERKSEARLLSCPVHEGSLDLVPRLKCPSCSSMLLRKGSLVQHSCGFIGSEDTFKPGTCPKCGKPAPPQSARKMGIWYECDSCKTRFAAPNVVLHCRKFNHEIPLQDAKLVDQASFTLVPEAAKAFEENVGVLVLLKQGLEGLGHQVELSGSVQGTSGVKHSFDLVITTGGKKIPLDIKAASNGEVGVEAVLTTYLKAFDTGLNTSVLVAVPKASEEARKSAKAYGMLLIEGKDSTAIIEQLKSVLKMGSSSRQVASSSVPTAE